jgi:hypothetical protein
MVSSYSFEYEPSTTQAIEIGEILSIEFPAGTTIPKSPDSFNVSIDNKQVLSIGSNGATLKIGSPVKIAYGKTYKFFINCDIANPRRHGEYTFKLVAPDGQEAVSPEYYIVPSPLKSRIYFKDPDQPNCGEWFNEPPILGFECLNPDAKIIFWFNDDTDKAMNYNGETRLQNGSQRAKITWQAEFARYYEEPQSVYFYLNTVKPPLSILEPKSETILTSKKNFTVVGDRGFTEMLTYGDNEKYQVTDSVFTRLNGVETQLLEGEIYETAKSEKVTYRFSQTFALNEGKNIAEIIARDQACNETVIKRTIILDTIPPKIEVLSPTKSLKFNEGEENEIRIRTESTATVYINNVIVSPLSYLGDNVEFASKYKVAKGVNLIKIEATDEAGNKATKNITFVAEPLQKKIVLTIDRPDWTVDGASQPPLKTPPTSTFTDPKHKALNGTTYMPIAEIAPFLDCKVSWDAKEKKITLKQSNKTIEMWLGKTTARIDGKEVKYNSKGSLYPVSVNGKTLIPLRFVAENLGAKVDFDEKSKLITILFTGGK